jgi:predicted RNase H-like HicB family nuclease
MIHPYTIRNVAILYKPGFRIAAAAETLLQLRPTRVMLKDQKRKDSIKKASNYKPYTRRKTVSQRKFTILYEKAPEGGYTGRCLELQGTRTEGETKEELARNMVEAIQLTLDYLKSISKNEQKMVIEMPA